MFKWKRKSDAKTSFNDSADETSGTDFSQAESNVRQDIGSRTIAKNETKKKKKSIGSKKDQIKPKTLKRTRDTATDFENRNNFNKNSETKENLVQNDAKFESLHRDEVVVKSLAANLRGNSHSDQKESRKKQIHGAMRINEEDQGGARNWRRSRNDFSSTSDSRDDDIDVKARGVQSECLSSDLVPQKSCCNGSKAGEFDSKEYQFFLRNMDRATGSSVIQSEDSYEKLRYSTPRIKRFKEVTTVSPELWNAKRTLFRGLKEPGKMRNKTRDMGTRNSNDIIIGGNSENRRLTQFGNSRLQKNWTHEPENREKFQDRSTMKSNESSEFNPSKKTPTRKLINGPNSACKLSIHRDAEAQTKTSSSSATEIANCCSLEKIRSLEKSVLRFLSQSRLAVTPEGNDDQSSATDGKTQRERIDLHFLVANVAKLNNFSIKNTEREVQPKKNFWNERQGSRKTCRCGNGCGISEKSTCRCKGI